MRHVPYWVIILLVMACNGGNDEKKEHSILSMKVDTVIIEPGEELLYLQSRLRVSGLSANKKYLYNFNSQENAIEKINLNTLAFEKKYGFEKEGPDGTGDNVSALSILDKGRLFISSFPRDHIFDWQGNKIESFDITAISKDLNQHQEGDRPYKTLYLDQGSRLVSLIQNFEKKSSKLAIINPKKKNMIKLSIPAIEKAKNFDLTLNSGGMEIALGNVHYLVNEGGQIILGTGVSNELYVMKIESDSLQYITYQSQLTPDEKTGSYPAIVGAQVELAKLHQQIQEDINFMAPVWDEKKQVYYRFSFHSLFEETKKMQGFPQPKGAKVFLSVLDKDFKLLAETQVSQLNQTPEYYFSKDGKLWVFENIEDEMGFVRLDISW
ncbi:DUF4221 family protein [Cyclobacterium marinum]|uniref:DUF4221 domain-containing protein n=1 Tax=Cyclobacterium marinum (strain ATCC 25205 / DSM 745 / LMG 13164 / NCIMB 1802) TaxID=880070 RepID=G0J3U5_CYCMS|nr:DUF4221 family protein [Cyclobacterium marinum]AEL25919.1 hypothetical protein Cycma_2174 [Cyclobacterium marinum DSM 745]MBR9774835.1 DUF4221 domain-containing protein [Cytophagales bacterium]|tara:strand:- start:4504 stop:5643 length:1140 start_codon:yes stop_codon:yes gene_type:complete